MAQHIIEQVMSKTVFEQWRELAVEVRALRRMILIILTNLITKLFK